MAIWKSCLSKIFWTGIRKAKRPRACERKQVEYPAECEDQERIQNCNNYRIWAARGLIFARAGLVISINYAPPK